MPAECPREKKEEEVAWLQLLMCEVVKAETVFILTEYIGLFLSEAWMHICAVFVRQELNDIRNLEPNVLKAQNCSEIKLLKLPVSDTPLRKRSLPAPLLTPATKRICLRATGATKLVVRRWYFQTGSNKVKPLVHFLPCSCPCQGSTRGRESTAIIVLVLVVEQQLCPRQANHQMFSYCACL